MSDERDDLIDEWRAGVAAALKTTVEKSNHNELEIAVIKTKIAMVVTVVGFVASLAGSLVGAVITAIILHQLKLK